MAKDMKKYIITAVTLGLIAAGGALLIAGTNVLTRDRIEANAQLKINEGLAKIFEVDVEKLNSSTANLPEGKSFTYVVNSYYEVKDENNAPLGYAFKTEGSNSYGKISLIVGFNKEYVYKGLSVVENGQSFATTLNKYYLNPLIKEDKTIDEVNVSCGATYGAKLVRDMVSEASTAAEFLKGANNG